MSDVVRHKRVIERECNYRRYSGDITELDFGDGTKPIKVAISNGKEGNGTCLGCHDAPCMILKSEELSLPDVVSSFPGDPAKNVCPTQAISWNEAGTSIVVDAELCIGCCLCVARCPYGAISSTGEGNVVVEDSDPSGLSTIVEESRNTQDHIDPIRIGNLAQANSQTVGRILEGLGSLTDIEATRFVRNLLTTIGIACRTRRKGDTNVRIDGLVSLADGHIGVIEIEFGNSVLESPRALLEDIAILHGRYDIQLCSIEAISFIVALPNARSEYFQVIADIETVLGIRCRTMTLGAVLTVLWSNLKIQSLGDNLFVTQSPDTSLLIGMKEHLSSSISNTEPYPGAYQPSK